jgi:hypothetical protein
MKTSHIIKKLREDSAYQEFFQKAMKKFDISSPSDLKDPEKKKNFFNYVDKNYSAKTEGKLREEYFPTDSIDEPSLRDAKKALASWFKNTMMNTNSPITRGKLDKQQLDILHDLIDDYAMEYARNYADNLDMERNSF